MTTLDHELSKMAQILYQNNLLANKLQNTTNLDSNEKHIAHFLRTHFNYALFFDVFQKPMSVSSDDGSSPRTTPSPTTLERSDSDRTDWDGLNLSLTAREMRERIGSKKKADPRKDKLDMRKKFDIIQTL